tara:strand:+ start:77 stop:340 length:264 start_codon:yes stop_codon:yes gene_type:complete
MTDEFTGFPFDDYFTEYQSLDGKKNRDEYFVAYQVFEDETSELWIDGNTIKHKSRKKSLDAVQKILEINDNELSKLFHSIDNVTAWT